uniref:Uncharacterized protein n=1 Tax=Cacopsylla melanoneura TaxID=428564 RepID=A0A8D8RVY2_9HEMI
MQVLEISYFSFKRMKNPNTIYSIFSHADVKNSWIKCRPCFYSSFITVGIKNGKNHFSHFYFSFPGEEKVVGEIFLKENGMGIFVQFHFGSEGQYGLYWTLH